MAGYLGGQGGEKTVYKNAFESENKLHVWGWLIVLLRLITNIKIVSNG